VTFVDGDRSAKYPKRTDFVTQGIPFLNAESISNGRLDASKANRISEAKFAEIKKGRLLPGDLILTTRGNGVGKPAFYSSRQPALINAQLLIIRPEPNKLEPRYLYYSFCDPSFQIQLQNFKSGSAQPQLPITALRELEFSFPSLLIQRKIAAVLSAYDDLIENNTRRIAILEAMAQVFYREWFVELRFPGHEKAKLVDSPLGKIPEGWASTVADFGKVTTGKTPSKTRPEYFGGEIPFVKTPDMHGNLFCISTTETLTNEGMLSQPAQTVPPNSVCVSCIGTVGAISITDATCQTNQQINTIVPHSRSRREFIYLCLRNSVSRLKQIGAAGATMDNISKGKLMSFDVLLPPTDILDQFSSHTSDFFDRIGLSQKQSAVLRKTRDLLLPKLISGQLDVEDLDIDSCEAVTE
jgi:type I restriction enzyme S subunit